MIKYDFKNGTNIYWGINNLFNDFIDDSFYSPNEENIFEGEADGEIYLNDGGIINIYASFDDEDFDAHDEKWFVIEIIEPSDIIDENIENLNKLVSKYKHWEIIE